MELGGYIREARCRGSVRIFIYDSSVHLFEVSFYSHC
jgi:hypothetical protein